jgi:hypothetical protein
MVRRMPPGSECHGAVRFFLKTLRQLDAQREDKE